MEKKILIGKKVKKICKKYNVKFLINDEPNLAKKLNTDGCHLGQKDMSINEARKILKNKIIGITCHNSIKLAKIAIVNNADYIAFGAFNDSITKIPVVAIGGINAKNYKKLLLNKANFLAISSYIWNNKNYKPAEAVEKIK